MLPSRLARVHCDRDVSDRRDDAIPAGQVFVKSNAGEAVIRKKIPDTRHLSGVRFQKENSPVRQVERRLRDDSPDERKAVFAAVKRKSRFKLYFGRQVCYFA